MNRLHIFLVGGPACGKDTQLNLLLDRFKSSDQDYTQFRVTKVPMSALLGEIIDLREYHESGKFVDDNIAIPCWNQACDQCADSSVIIHNGFPRTATQVGALLENNIIVNGYCIFFIFNLSDETMLSRMQCRGREEACASRISTHHETFDSSVSEIKRLFSSNPKSRVCDIDGSKSIIEIQRLIWSQITSHLALEAMQHRFYTFFEKKGAIA